MENASKALLIAGAVLIVILLIGVGMLIYNSSAGIWGEAKNQMSALEIDTFNNQFEQYEGTTKTKTDVETLFRKIRTNNLTAENTVTFNSDTVSVAAGTLVVDATGLVKNVVVTANLSGHAAPDVGSTSSSGGTTTPDPE